MTQPYISIIIPIYRVEQYLNRCITSIQNQTLKNIEIILVDDGSPDNCPILCDEYAKQDSRIKVIHKKNGGLGLARNSGLEIATGKFISFIDSDDFIEFDMLEKLFSKALEENLDTVFCGCKFYNNGIIKERKEVKTFTQFIGESAIKNLLLDIVGPLPNYKSDVKYMMSVWHAIYSKEIIDKYNIRFCSERELVSEDLIFDIDYIMKARRIGYIPDCLYFYCMNENSLSRTFHSEKYNKYKIFLDEVERKLKEYYTWDEYWLHLYRLKLLYLRSALMNTKNLHNLSEIIKDKYWENLLDIYPYKQLPIKHQIYFFCIKNKLTYILKLLQK